MPIQPTDRDACLRFAEDPSEEHGAVTPPLYETSLFTYKSYDAYVKARKAEQEHYVYWRGTNPTVEIAERKLAALEGGESCKCFASGMAAIAAALLSQAESGSHVVVVSHVYEETQKLLQYLRKKFQVDYTITSGMDVETIRQAIVPATRVIYMESPTDLLYRIVDLQAVAALARERGIATIIDNTWSTPLFQKPLQLGIDLVVHSASKYLGGHSDLVGGAVVGRRELLSNIFDSEYLLLGAALAPYEALQLLKGLRTLPLRLEAHERSALQVARYLEGHPAVARVHYPGLESHPDYALARKQMNGFTGLFSFELKEAGYEAVRNTINRLRLLRLGVSWGSFESLVLSPNEGSNEDKLRREGLSPGLIRLSIGLESPEALIADLAQALSP